MSWLKQALGFLCVAMLCTLGTYLIVGEYDRSVKCDQGQMEANEVCLSTVLDNWKGDVIWVDARAEEEKTIMLEPSLEISELNAEAELSSERVMMTLFKAKGEGTKVVVFCQTDGCGSSVYVREKILSKSLQRPELVYYLHGGWKSIEGDGRLLEK